ncbi:RPL14 [Symbiodinium necroappetens]|uniref:RPL14 protein n=1 Tax=Symbiodinium necroappetens TaxID=1628268 RepID=A0A812J384_9DINO|nr:RPL14 [Symbiodinium necroappetens]
MDWYERRKNLLLGATLPTQNFALVFVLPSRLWESWAAAIKVALLLVAAFWLPTRWLCLSFACCRLQKEEPSGAIYAIFWDGLAIGRLMRLGPGENRVIFLASLKASSKKACVMPFSGSLCSHFSSPPPCTPPSPRHIAKMAQKSMFTRFVQPGRLALITFGPCAGKMCTIVDIVDQKRVVVDGPESLTGVRRHMMPVKRLSLTDFRMVLDRGVKEKTLKKALEKGEVLKKWSETAWAKKMKAKEARANMTDFERFKVAKARTARSKAVKKAVDWPGVCSEEVGSGDFDCKVSTVRRTGLSGGRVQEEPEATVKLVSTCIPAKMAQKSMFTRFVQPGRLALITFGPCAGKMCTIVDIVDQKRVVVDGPESLTGVRRHMMPVKRLSLTDFRMVLDRGVKEKTLKKALEKGEVLKKWSETAWAKKMKAKEARANMTDFERFKVAKARTARSKAVKKALKK